MKKILIITLLLFIPYICHSQVNLVRNPSFEKYTGCPFGPALSYLATGWNGIDSNWYVGGSYPAPFCLASYINACAILTSNVGVPAGGYYHQYPRTGNGMMGYYMYAYYPGDSPAFAYYYLQGRLYRPLTAGQSYCVTFYTSLGDGAGYAINHIGAYLDAGYIDTASLCYLPQSEYTPQVVEDSILRDTSVWVKVQGSFIANGTEKFITIGNFFDTTHFSKIRVNGIGATLALLAYYLVDDVSVIASGTAANAGPDVLIGLGDTATIGIDSNGEGMPCYWYAAVGGTGGSWQLIDSGGTIKVAPDTTTTYVVVMDLCGNVTTDTVTVMVYPLAVSPLSPKGGPMDCQVFPNPATTYLNIVGVGDCKININDMMGRTMINFIGCRGSAGLTMTTNKINMDISSLAKGVYSVEITDMETGERVVKKVVKE